MDATNTKYVCYTDGAYSSSRDQGGIGVVVIKDNKIVLEYNKMYPNTTNNRMEIQAAITALDCLKNPIDELTIFTDSMYVVGCVRLGWKREKNPDLWEKFDKAYERASKLCPSITFIHVKGHNGDPNNSKADELAVQASHYEE